MTIYINGDPVDQSFANLAEVVASVSSAQGGIAAAVDGVVVPRSQWPSTPIAMGARVEIVTAVQGG